MDFMRMSVLGLRLEGVVGLKWSGRDWVLAGLREKRAVKRSL
jgi:hypothetical protein